MTWQEKLHEAFKQALAEKAKLPTPKELTYWPVAKDGTIVFLTSPRVEGDPPAVGSWDLPPALLNRPTVQERREYNELCDRQINAALAEEFDMDICNGCGKPHPTDICEQCICGSRDITRAKSVVVVTDGASENCCPGCGAELCAALDAYYGDDPGKQGLCQKCQRK